MKNNKILVVLIGALLAFPALADNQSGGIGGYWDHVKTDWLGFRDGAKPFYFRAGYTDMAPKATSSEVYLENVGGIAQLAVDNGPIAGSSASIESTKFPSMIIGMQLPWGNGAWSVETVLALPLTVKFQGGGTLANESIAAYALNNIPTGVPALGTEFGESKVLPPLVTMVYRFRHLERFRPYVGAGLAYLYSYDAKVTNPILTAVSDPKLTVDPAFGVVAQAGMEYRFWGDWFANLDVKFVGGLKTTATVKDIWVETPGLPLYQVARVGDAKMDVTVNPWVYHIGFGFNF